MGTSESSSKTPKQETSTPLSKRNSSNNAAVAKEPPKSNSFATSLVAGGLAGTSVDVALFPIDTLKTRLQSPQGFMKAGGFRGIYNGLGAAALGSAPGAALFFSMYESMKPVMLKLTKRNLSSSSPLQPYSESISHMAAASIGEAFACLVRVPTEVVKAKMQTSTTSLGLFQTIQYVVRSERHGILGPIVGGLYRGYGITLMREIPFAIIQFPLYEYFKVVWARRQSPSPLQPWQGAICGSIAGGIAAGATTPLDVLKTRLMLGKDAQGVPYRNAFDVLSRILRQEPRGTLWSGIQPRVMWISIGGFVFFGAYETFSGLISPTLG